MVLVILGFAFIILVDLPPLLRDKSSRELMVFVAIFILGLIMAVLTALGIHIPSAIIALGRLLKMIGLSWGSG